MYYKYIKELINNKQHVLFHFTFEKIAANKAEIHNVYFIKNYVLSKNTKIVLFVILLLEFE